MKWCRYIVLVLGLLCFCQQSSYAQEPRKPFLYLKGNTLYLEGEKFDKSQEYAFVKNMGGRELLYDWKEANNKIRVGRSLNVLSIVTMFSGTAISFCGAFAYPAEEIFYGDSGAMEAKTIMAAGGIIALSGVALNIISLSYRKKGFSEKQRIIDEFNMGPTRNGVGLTFTF